MRFGQQKEGGEGGGWVTAKEWTGVAGSITTEPFAVPGRPFRISYEATSEDRGGVLDIIVYTRDNEYVTGAYSIQRNAPGSFVVDRPLKECVLEIRSHLMRWKVTVDRRA
jgi:hypothetical protein